MPASAVRLQLDHVARGVGNPGDALNLVEAGGYGAHLFLTADKNTIGALVGSEAVMVFPYTNGLALPIRVIGF